jgi:D-alanyl-D-alanine dipeptidase
LYPALSNGHDRADRLLLRAPALLAVEEANELLKPYNRELMISDGFRPIHRQAQMFCRVLERFTGSKVYEDLSLFEKISLGRKTNASILYVDIIKDAVYDEETYKIRQSSLWPEFVSLAEKFCISSDILLHEFLVYETNGGRRSLTLDTISNTAHGTGGAIDVWLIDRSTGRFVNRGIPSSYNNVSAVMDYFEWATSKMFQQEVDENSRLKEYLHDFGIEKIDDKCMLAIREERRLLFHAMMTVGASYFSLGKTEGECWHFNFGNERGGHQYNILPNAGNPSHSLLKNIRDPKNGQITAVWGNEVAHELARELLDF